MSIETVEIRAFSGPSVVEINGSDQPAIVEVNQGPQGPNIVDDLTQSDGTANLSLNSLTFNNAPVAPVTTPGSLSWNDQEGTLDLKMKGGNVTLQVGQENVIRVVNKTGGNLTQAGFKVVRVRKASEGGAQGQRLAVVLAQGDDEFDSTDVIGVVTENILVNQEGFVTTFGTVNGINTTGSLYGETWVDGELLFLSPTTPGGLTKVKPTAPNHLVIVGYVQYAHQNNGKLFVKTETSYELNELHNVAISDPATGEVLAYNGTTGLWENTEISTSITTSTPTNLTGYIYGDGSTVAGATLATVVQDPDTLVLRDVNGSSEFYSLSINPDTGSGFSSTIDAFNDGSLESNITFTLPLASGTGAITGNANGVVDIAHGGTNATTVSEARANLNLGPSGTLTTSQPLSLTQTWSTTATYKAIDVNITDSGPSNAASTLMDLRVDGTSKAAIYKNGNVVGGNFTGGNFTGNYGSFGGIPASSQSRISIGVGAAIVGVIQLGNSVNGLWVLDVGSNILAQIGTNSLTYFRNPVSINGNDVVLARDAANTLAQRNGANAQVTRVYDTYTSATDYHRLAIATARATATAMSGATITLTNIIPAGAVVVGVTCKVTTAITGATSFDIGTATDVDRFGAAIAVALGTTSDNRNWTSGTIECFPTATSLILTANGSNFTAGAVYVSVQYLSGQAD